MNYFYIILIITVVTLSFVYWKFNQIKLFYDAQSTYPHLKKIHKLRPKIMKELSNILVSNDWQDWPEKHLYDNSGDWDIYPLLVFGTYSKKNCEKMPTLTKFIKSVPDVRIAILSRLSPGMKLAEHQGWASHSNYVLKAHYGLIVPKNKCYLKVREGNNEQIKYHKEDEWMLFDDSMMHMAENKSKKDRIVLIMDIKRPKYLKKGNSKFGDTEELINIVTQFKKQNK